jgi:hypothetical protein
MHLRPGKAQLTYYDERHMPSKKLRGLVRQRTIPTERRMPSANYI